jgi:hypothetical protein
MNTGIQFEDRSGLTTDRANRAELPGQAANPLTPDHLGVAIRCFEHCITLHPNPDSRPDEFELYNGLLCLAKSMRQIAADTEEIRRMTGTNVGGKV